MTNSPLPAELTYGQAVLGSEPMVRFGALQHRPGFAALAAVFLGVIVGIVAGIGLFPRNALAGGLCGASYHLHEDAETTDANGAVHHGTRVADPGMWIYGSDTEPPVCIHVSSVLSQSVNDSWVEIGWISAAKGVPLAGSGGSCVDSGSGNPWAGDGNPQLFRTNSKDGGATWHCTVFSDITTVNRRESFEVLDPAPLSGNDTWQTRYAGSAIGSSLAMPFSLSVSVTNAERFTPSTAAYPTGEAGNASFDGLLYFTSSSGWHAWTSADCGNYPFSDNDPTYKDNNLSSSPTFVSVSLTGTWC